MVKETTLTNPTGKTTLNFTSTAPPVDRETFIGFPLNVLPVSRSLCNGKLTPAARKLLESKKKFRGRLTITVTKAGGKSTSSSHTVTIKLEGKKKHAHK